MQGPKGKLIFRIDAVLYNILYSVATSRQLKRDSLPHTTLLLISSSSPYNSPFLYFLHLILSIIYDYIWRGRWGSARVTITLGLIFIRRFFLSGQAAEKGCVSRCTNARSPTRTSSRSYTRAILGTSYRHDHFRCICTIAYNIIVLFHSRRCWKELFY